MAHKKGEGSTQNGRDSNPKRLGVKLFSGQYAKAGSIIVRQRGTKFHIGENAYLGKDYSIHAAVEGTVAFKRKKDNKTFVSVVPLHEVKETLAKVEPRQTKPAPELASAPVVEELVAEKKPAKASASEKITLPSGQSVKLNDLKLIEGIGPKIEELFHNAGITTWAALASADIEKLKEILAEAGSRYKMHDPTTWAKQAQLADEGNWEALEAYQAALKGGKAQEEE